MLKLAPTEPAWLELIAATEAAPAVRVLFAPITMKTVRAARRAAAAVFGVDPEDVEEAGDAMSREVIRRGILEWEGVGDAAGEPIAVSPETIELFIADPRAMEAADTAYFWPWVRADREARAPGKGSAPSPNGTSDQTAIAASPAPDATAPIATSAPIASTKRRPRRRKASGTS